MMIYDDALLKAIEKLTQELTTFRYQVHRDLAEIERLMDILLRSQGVRE
jgi:hypothetical protein